MRRPFVFGGLVWALVVLGGGVVAAATDGGEGDPARPWVDAMVEEAMEDDEAPPRETAECFLTAVVDAIGVEQLEAEDVSPRDLARADDLDEVDVEIEPDALAQLRTTAGTCELGASIAEPLADELMDGLADEVGVELDADAEEAGRACLAETLVADPRLVDLTIDGYVTGYRDEVGAGMEATTLDALTDCPLVMSGLLAAGLEHEGLPVGSEVRSCIDTYVANDGGVLRAAFANALATGDVAAAGASWMSSIIQACPQLMSDSLIVGFEQGGLPPGPTGSACIAAEIAARPDEVVAVVSDPAAEAAIAFAEQIAAACLPQFDG